MRHTITVKDMMDWINTEIWHNAASCHGNGSSKKLEMNNTGAFRVTDHDKIVYIGGHLPAAVDAYNAAR